jgi:hypothetical protein
MSLSRRIGVFVNRYCVEFRNSFDWTVGFLQWFSLFKNQLDHQRHQRMATKKVTATMESMDSPAKNHNHDPGYYPVPNHAGRPVQRSLEKKERIDEELSLSELSHYLMLAHTSLFAIPTSIFVRQDDYLTKLRRLDISHNCVHSIPKEIILCTNLRELWMSYNPIKEFTFEIVKLPRLEVLDIKHTKIHTLPSEVIDLSNLIELDWRETPLEKTLQEDFDVPVNDLLTLQTVFRNINIRHKTREALFAYLFGEHYVQDAYKDYAATSIDTLVDVSTQVHRLILLHVFDLVCLI